MYLYILWGLVRMKKYILLLMAAMFLVACGSNEEAEKQEETEDVEEELEEELEEDNNEEDERSIDYYDDEVEEVTAHIDINDELIGDSYQIVNAVVDAVKDNREPNMSLIDDYSEKYILDNDELDLTHEENELILATGIFIIKLDDYMTIDSERRDIQNDIDNWYDTLETGELHHGE